MSIFTDAYSLLLIKQYWEKPRARAEIELKAASWEVIHGVIDSFINEFDIDNAYGDRLDIIGSIIGMPRNIQFLIDKIAFGFSENVNARGFDDRFLTVSDVATFLDKFEPTRTPLDLNDADYRAFIKAKIMSNIAAAFMVSDERVSINDAINVAFEGQAYAIDNKDMTLTLYVSIAFDTARLDAIRQLDLLPKPMGVLYKIIQYDPDGTFGFSDNPIGRGFADKFDPLDIGGIFATRLV